MPIHDWTKVTAGIFHDFHSAWISEIRLALNGGVLPAGYYALAEQVAGNTIPDVLTLQGAEPEESEDGELADESGGIAVAAAPPRTLMHGQLSEARILAARRKRIVIRHSTGDRVVALLEIVSPGNKGSQEAVDQFVDKAEAALDAGFQLMVLDLFAPGRFDAGGMHGVLWSRMGGNHEQPDGKPLTLAAYATAGAGLCDYYLEPTSVDSALIDMPLFLSVERYVNVPLEQTYLAAYEGVPRRWKTVIES